jgi:HD-like signal output (HDOD) protein
LAGIGVVKHALAPGTLPALFGANIQAMHQPNQSDLDRYIDGIKNLPPSPTVMVELINLLQKPDRDVDQLVDLMSRDPSLTAEALRRCNSALLGYENRATDIFEATFRLGFYEVYRLATALFAARTVGFSGAAHGLDLESVWQHSALAASVAKCIAQNVEENEAVAFTAGLLHDVGKVVLACADGARYAQIGSAHSQELTQMEKKLFGFTHSEVGGRLLARWGLPANIAVPVRFYDQPRQAAPFERLAAILNLADSLTSSLRQPDTPSDSDAFAIELLGLSAETLSGMKEAAQAEAEQVQELFQLQSAA